jgi:hypothetical protein
METSLTAQEAEEAWERALSDDKPSNELRVSKEEGKWEKRVLGELKPFSSNYLMSDAPWNEKKVGNSINDPKNYMNKIGCLVTGLVNVINTLTGKDITPGYLNEQKDYFPETEDDDKNSDIYINQVANDYGLIHTQRFNNFEDAFLDIVSSTNFYVVLAKVKFRDNDSRRHYVGVNGFKNIKKFNIKNENLKKEELSIPYIEIVPTSEKDLNKNLRKSTWVFMEEGNNKKVYAPFSDIIQLEIFRKK